MKRITYLFIIIISVFVVSFIIREQILFNSRKCNDEIKCNVNCSTSFIKGYTLESEEQSTNKVQAVEVKYDDLHGGIVVDSKAGFYHRFFYVSIYNDHITIFNMYGSICRETGIPLDAVDIRYRELISKGVYFENIDDAEEFADAIK